eukprot:GHVR01063126.1.p1 GENE.GHVR01063126.1~~GHVR01063126.1.p1  ORF type:complete len:280 (-),score=41.43 GHVR01063126.1:170-1009(-)
MKIFNIVIFVFCTYIHVQVAYVKGENVPGANQEQVSSDSGKLSLPPHENNSQKGLGTTDRADENNKHTATDTHTDEGYNADDEGDPHEHNNYTKEEAAARKAREAVARANPNVHHSFGEKNLIDEYIKNNADIQIPSLYHAVIGKFLKTKDFKIDLTLAITYGQFSYSLTCHSEGLLVTKHALIKKTSGKEVDTNVLERSFFSWDLLQINSYEVEAVHTITTKKDEKKASSFSIDDTPTSKDKKSDRTSHIAKKKVKKVAWYDLSAYIRKRIKHLYITQ